MQAATPRQPVDVPAHAGLIAQARELAALRALTARRAVAPIPAAPLKPAQLMGYPVMRGGLE